MENAGFTPVFVNELNEHAMATYLANRHHVVGGKPFAEQEHLRCNDAHDLEGEGLDKMVRALEGLGLEIATPDDARSMLALKGGDRVNF